MHVTDALLGEHGVFHLLVEQLEHAVGRTESLAELRAATEPLAIALIGHARIEDEALFAPYEQATGSLGPLKCLRHEHEQIDRGLRRLFAIDDLERLRAEVRKMLDLTRRHLAREEEVMFTAARQVFDAETLERLGSQWAQFRSVTLAAMTDRPDSSAG